MDLNQTHVLHPDWTPHARMHLVWLVITNSSLSLVALGLLWRPSWDRAAALRMAAILSLCVLGGFLLSAAALPFYQGSLSDPGGVPAFGPVDSNLLAFSAALVLLLAGWRIASRAVPERSKCCQPRSGGTPPRC